tara:strand:- start:18986 stop:19447 length:462 start_codon:yes stop_codon:yes gene_type:complete
MNRLTICGNIGKVMTAKTRDNKIVVNFSVATDASYKGKDGQKVEKTDWHNCVVFQRGDNPGLAGMLNEHLVKGASVLVSGPIKYETWRKTGEESDRITAKLYVEDFEFVGRKVNGNSSQNDAADGPDMEDMPPLSEQDIEDMSGPHYRNGMEP